VPAALDFPVSTQCTPISACTWRHQRGRSRYSSGQRAARLRRPACHRRTGSPLRVRHPHRGHAGKDQYMLQGKENVIARRAWRDRTPYGRRTPFAACGSDALSAPKTRRPWEGRVITRRVLERRRSGATTFNRRIPCLHPILPPRDVAAVHPATIPVRQPQAESAGPRSAQQLSRSSSA